MQRSRVGVQIFLVLKQRAQIIDQCSVRILRRQTQVGADRADDFFFISLIVVQRKTELRKSRLCQAFQHHLQRRRFFGHKQHFLTVIQRLSDDICDGLALSGPRRSLHDKTDALPGEADGLLLTGIGIDDLAPPSQRFRSRGVILQSSFLSIRGAFRDLFQRFRVPRDRPDHGIFHNQIRIVTQVMIHADLQK